MPNRLIKDTIRTSKKINSLSDFEFRFWTYLITYVDDYGRGSADPELINNIVFPRIGSLTEEEVSKTIDSLCSKGCICLYESDGEPYLYFPNWSKHQSVRNKRSKFPDPFDCECEKTKALEIKRNQMNANVPVIQSNPIQSNPNPNPNAREGENNNNQKAVNDYLNRINPEASPTSMRELMSFEESLGTDVCIRAFDIALDEKKTTWSYIKAILQNWKSRGIHCVADLEEMQTKRDEEKNPKSRGQTKLKQVIDENGYTKWVKDENA